MRALVTAGLVTALLLAGCGQKGPLVLPDKKKPTAIAAPAAIPAPAAKTATPPDAATTPKG